MSFSPQPNQVSLLLLFTVTTAAAGLCAVGRTVGADWLVCTSIVVLLFGIFLGMALDGQ